MNKMNFEESTKYLENMSNLRVDAFLYNAWETEASLREQTINLLKKMSLLRLLVIKDTTNSIVVKADIDEEIKRRVDLATKTTIDEINTTEVEKSEDNKRDLKKEVNKNGKRNE